MEMKLLKNTLWRPLEMRLWVWLALLLERLALGCPHSCLARAPSHRQQPGRGA